MNRMHARTPLTRTRGFTFVEILAAMVFMAIVIPVAIQGITMANRIGVSAQRKRIATQLADRQLSEIVLTREWESGSSQGDFGEDYPNYKWTMTADEWSEDDMIQVTVEVAYQVQGQDNFVRLSTLVDKETLTIDYSQQGQAATATQ